MATERTVICVYRGARLETMRLLFITSDRQLVADVAERLLELDQEADRRELAISAGRSAVEGPGT